MYFKRLHALGVIITIFIEFNFYAAITVVLVSVVILAIVCKSVLPATIL